MGLLGYLENWGPAVKWWDENFPGHCLMGCFKETELLAIMKDYSALNYGFALLTPNTDPDQDGCTGGSPGKTSPPAGPCPMWDGENIYLAKSSKQDAIAVNSGTTIDKPTSSIVAITEAVRMGRMRPDGPKRVKIVLGGWSDYARIGSVANGEKLAKVMAKFVAHTFADGVDLDLEHLTPYQRMGDEWMAWRPSSTHCEQNWMEWPPIGPPMQQPKRQPCKQSMTHWSHGKKQM